MAGASAGGGRREERERRGEVGSRRFDSHWFPKRETWIIRRQWVHAIRSLTTRATDKRKFWAAGDGQGRHLVCLAAGNIQGSGREVIDCGRCPLCSRLVPLYL